MQEKKVKNQYKVYLVVFFVIIYLVTLFFVAYKYINSNRYWDIHFFETNVTAVSGQDIYIKASITNKMYYVLGSRDNYFISYHIYDKTGGTFKYENPRTNIEDVRPGLSEDVDIQIKVPTEKGRYKIEVDIVKEGEYWFKDRGESPGVLYLKVN